MRTGIAYAAACLSTDIAYAAAGLCAVRYWPRLWYALPGTDLGYGATRPLHSAGRAAGLVPWR
eukprot:3656123-Rhodomonas_salina.7